MPISDLCPARIDRNFPNVARASSSGQGAGRPILASDPRTDSTCPIEAPFLSDIRSLTAVSPNGGVAKCVIKRLRKSYVDRQNTHFPGLEAVAAPVSVGPAGP